MSIEMIEKYRQIFPNNGEFILRENENIRNRVREEMVPNEPGVYVIYSKILDDLNIVYIGKSGSLIEDGSFKNQMLRKRLCNKQNDMSRVIFFPKMIRENNFDALIFKWFVTFSEDIKILPGKAEMDLLQSYYDKYKKPPIWNKSI